MQKKVVHFNYNVIYSSGILDNRLNTLTLSGTGKVDTFTNNPWGFLFPI